MSQVTGPEALEPLFELRFIRDASEQLCFQYGEREYTAYVVADPDHTNKPCHYCASSNAHNTAVEIEIREIVDVITGTLKKGPHWNKIAKMIRQGLLHDRPFCDKHVKQFVDEFKGGIKTLES